MGCLLILGTPFLCVVLCLGSYLVFPPKSTNIAILGVDARPGERYLTRTDTFMLLNVKPSRLRVSLFSIPRDVYIDVPYYGEQRINTINVLGEQEAEGNGPALVKASVQQSFDINVDYYVRLDFNGFVELVDAVGGIDIDVPHDIIDYDYPTTDGGTTTIEFQEGKQHMNGERALQYARTRHADDDYHRAERQQIVVDALVRKLSNPVYWPAVLQALQNNMDTDMSTWDMIRLAPGLLLGWPNSSSRVMDREDLLGRDAGYAIPNYDKMRPWIQSHFH